MAPPTDLRLVPYGRPAAEALREVIDDYKAGDVLGPVTVVVPGNFVGLSMRRLLASGAAGPIAGVDGVANVGFHTTGALAGLLAGPELARRHRAPLSQPVLVSTMRRVLAAEPGLFAPVADHPATERALAAAYLELSEASPVTLERLVSQGERPAAVVRLVGQARARLRAWHDEREANEIASAVVVDHPDLLAELGPVVWYLPGREAPSALGLLAALARRVPMTVVAALTGADSVDEQVWAATAPLGLDPGSTVADPDPDPRAIAGFATATAGTRIVSVPDADEEVRTALREVLARVDAGGRLDRMAILYPARQPYLLALHEQLEAARVPFNGPATQTLGQTIVGRTLLGLLALPDHQFRRDDVIALLAAAPLRQADGRPVNATRWDRVSRQAGVVATPEGWDERLDDFVGRLRSVVDDPDSSPGRRAAVGRDVESAADLRAFVARVVSDLDIDRSAVGWVERARWAKSLLDRYLGQVRLRDWPDHEQQALERVHAVLDRLAGLDPVEPDPSIGVFRQMLDYELEVAARRHGRFGEGLLVSSVHLAPGLDLDTVVVLGLAEGTFPARPRDNVLLPDREREAATRDRFELPLRRHGVLDDQRALEAALASAPDRLLFFPRGDVRRGRHRLPSRWLLQIANELSDGDRVGTETFDDWTRDADEALFVESFVDGVLGSAAALPPVSGHDLDLRLLFGRVEQGHDVDAGLLDDDPVLTRGLRTIDARRSAGFTSFDGNLSGRQVADLTSRTLSPTSLERYAVCPFRWFLGDVLHLAELDRPEAALTINALDRGTLVHLVLERFVQEVIDEGGVDGDWTEADERRLIDLADEVFDEFEHQANIGKPLAWQYEKQLIRSDLRDWLELDRREREQHAVSPILTEMPFGLDGEPPLEVTTASGRTLRFRGLADRVDRGDDGNLLVVDYKTGGSNSYRELAGDDPVVRGTRLQLPIYGLAARARHGASDDQVDTAYWFVSHRGGHRSVGLELDEAVEARFGEVVDVIADGIEGGVYPARPGEWDRWRGGHENCHFCDFNRLCRTDRLESWERKVDDPQLERYAALAEPFDDVDVEQAEGALDAPGATADG